MTSLLWKQRPPSSRWPKTPGVRQSGDEGLRFVRGGIRAWGRMAGSCQCRWAIDGCSPKGFESGLWERYFLFVRTAEKIFRKAQTLPEEAQTKLLRVAEDLAREYPPAGPSPLTLQEA